MVISGSINKYCYINIRNLPPYFNYKYKLRYFLNEQVSKIDKIKHPVIRECLKNLNYTKKGIEMVHSGDIPARSGVGSSSSFTVGFLNALFAHIGYTPTKRELALKALEIEQDILKESVGSQDQIAAAYGGFNSIKFFKNGKFKVTKIKISKKNKEKLSDRLILLYTGVQRTAQNIASKYVNKLNNSKKNQMKDILDFVPKAKLFLQDGKLDDFGYLLDESWQKKKN